MLYICRIIITGWRRALLNSDLWSLNPRDRSQTVVPQLANSWQRQVNKTRSAIFGFVMMMMMQFDVVMM